MNRWMTIIFVVVLLVIGMGAGYSQDSEPVPTLIPPTLVPTIEAVENDILRTQSNVVRIRENGVIRVGILYNEPPFGQLNIRGELVGFDADLGRSFAELWDVEVQFVQVTRQNAFEMLQNDQVDMLIAAQVHHREADAIVEFSQTYYAGQQAMMVRADDTASVSLISLANRRVGYVAGTDSEVTVNDWVKQTGIPVTTQAYLTFDRAYVALVMGEVDGVVGRKTRLLRVATQPDLIKFLDEPVTLEPYGVVVPRQDIHLRNLVNRSLQYLLSTGQLEQIHNTHLPGEPFEPDILPVWSGLGEDPPQLSQFGGEISYADQYTMPRILNGATLRVVGVDVENVSGLESERRVNTLNRALVDQIAARWGVQVDYVPLSAGNPLQLVASGQADLAVGVEPNWNQVNQVDFTAPYLLHGDRLMVEVNGRFGNFNDLRGRWVAVMGNDPGAADRAQAWADSINASIRIYTTNETSIADAILVENNADVAYGDSLKLIPYVQADPDTWELTLAPDGQPRWYSRSYMTMAVPRNDLDFRILVEYTLQEMILDGTLESLIQPVSLPGEMPRFDIWPGPNTYLGLSLAGRR